MKGFTDWNLFTYYAVTIFFHDTMISFRGPIPSADHSGELGNLP